MEIKGKVLQVCEQKSGTSTSGEWTSQDFIIETDGQYPKKVCLNCFKKPTPKVGEMVNVFFDPESREYNGNWFTTLRVWKFETGTQPAPTETTTAPPAAQYQTPTQNDSPLPF